MKSSTQFIVIVIIGTKVIQVQKIMKKGTSLFVLTDVNGINLSGYKQEKTLEAFFVNGFLKQ
jgi:hypothetical protein